MITSADQLTGEEFGEERDRIRAIVATGKVVAMPNLAEILAFDTDLNTDQANRALHLAAQDRNFGNRG